MFSAKAQNYTRSAYSQFGIGMLVPTGFAQQLSGALCVNALYDSLDFSLRNPASLSGLKRTVINGGLGAGMEFFTNGIQNQRTWNANFNGLVLAFPVSRTKGIGASIALLPYSTRGFTSQSSGEVLGADNKLYSVTNTFNGSGGLNKMAAAAAFRVLNYFRFGASGYVLFGTEKNDLRSTYEPAANFYDYREESTSGYRGLGNDLGFQVAYRLKTRDKDTFLIRRYARTDTLIKRTETEKFVSFGLTYTPEMRVNGWTDIYGRTILTGSLYDIDRDTSVYGSDLSTRLIIPQRLTAGLSFGKLNAWGISADAQYQQWAGFSKNGNSSAVLADEIGGSAGFYRRMNYRGRFGNNKGMDRYFTLRAAVRYAKTGVVFSHNEITDMGISLGVGLPIRTQRSTGTINIGLDLGRMGASTGTSIQNNYFKVTISANFYELWFIRRKLE